MKNNITLIISKTAPSPVGPYSQAIDTGDLVFCSGQIGTDPKTGELVEGIENQTKQVMENLKSVLAAANLDFSAVVKTDIFLSDLANYAKVNEIYGSFLKEPYPARTTVEVSKLPREALVEISMTSKK
jgi:2-iminobutanoate/2-iminopropanoate deaminase